MSQELYPFQADLIARVAAQAASGKRIMVIQGTTGCGKNTIAADIVRRAMLKEKSVLFMVHRRPLVNQISDRLIQHHVLHGVLMRGEQADRGCRVQVASRDTLLSRCVRNQWVGMPPADLVLVDEAQHAASPDSEYRRIIEFYPRAIVLLLSATPVGPDGRGLGPWAQAIECAAPTTELIRDGYLMPVKCFAPDRKKRRGTKYVRGMAGDLVESWKMYGEDRPTVLFCGRVQHSMDAVEAYRAEGITAAHIDADTSDDVREEVFEKVADGRIKILSNVGIVGEGVDVPELSCCQIFREMGGRVGFLQACGRVMRPAPWADKRYGILIDHAGAVFRHGFPDEDTEWTLEGNVDAAFVKKHKEGETEKAFYCKNCELAYHGQSACPQCGRTPTKPPRSIFAAPKVETNSEALVEADRNGEHGVFSREEKIKHWMRCLALAANKNGTFAMAGAIFHQKYNEYPDQSFPCHVGFGGRSKKVVDVYPNFRRTKKSV